MRTLLIALAMLSMSVAKATPIQYDATFGVTNLQGAVPADWGTVGLGTTLNMQFTWDSDAATQETALWWSGGPLSQYVMEVGDATIYSSVTMEAYRNGASSSILPGDIQPRVCTQPVCAGGLVTGSSTM